MVSTSRSPALSLPLLSLSAQVALSSTPASAKSGSRSELAR